MLKLFSATAILALSATPTLAAQTIDAYSIHEAPYYVSQMTASQADAREAAAKANARSQRDLERNRERMMGNEPSRYEQQMDRDGFNK